MDSANGQINFRCNVINKLILGHFAVILRIFSFITAIYFIYFLEL
jgi:hypothetical protein